jgi:hypothetical protein
MEALSGTFNMIHPEPSERADGLRRLRVLLDACGRSGPRSSCRAASVYEEPRKQVTARAAEEEPMPAPLCSRGSVGWSAGGRARAEGMGMTAPEGPRSPVMRGPHALAPFPELVLTTHSLCSS